MLRDLKAETGAALYGCDAADPTSVAALFTQVAGDLGTPSLVVHNIDGRVPDIFRKKITEADPALALQTIKNGAYSAFLVAQQAAAQMLAQPFNDAGHRGSIIFTNASAATKGYANSGAFAMACQAKAGLAQSASTSPRFPSTPPSAGPRRTARAVIGGRARRSTTIWPTRIASPRFTCSYTASTAPPGPSKWCCGHGWRRGDPSRF